MTTTATTPTTLDVSATSRVPFGRLVRLELRKMADTRAGLWLMIVTGLLLVVAGGLTLLITLLNDVDLTLGDMVQVMTVPLSLLLPVFAIMTVTSEWSQRTGLVTFTLEPHRLRMVAAKLVAVVGLAVATIVVAAAFGVAVYAIFAAMTSGPVSWAISSSVLAWTVIGQLLSFLVAFGFALAFLNTPAAISVYYVVVLLLPIMVYSLIMGALSWGPDVVPWIDLGTAMAPLQGSGPDVTATTYAQVAVTSLEWVVLPFVLGLVRVRRAEIK
ncbi:MAG: ABC transporter permease [Nocardioides sp.]